MRSSDIRLRSAAADTERFAYRTPMKFGGRVVTDAVVLNVRLEAERGDGRRAVGRGSMTMGNAWAWPSQQLSAEQTLRAVLALAERLVEHADRVRPEGHPLVIAHELAEVRRREAEAVVREMALAEPMPVLAQLLAASPLEAALFDAHGRANDASSYRLLSREYLEPDLGHFLGNEFAGLRLDAFVRPQPQPEMPLYHLVGALDPLAADDVAEPVGDGLPETLAEWIEADGLSHLKIKLAGDDLDWDARRVADVSRTADASSRGADAPWAFSLDFNERCENEDYVLEMLERLGATSPRGLERIQYIEQPTHRDLDRHRHNTMHRATARLPVVIDESLTDLESLLMARDQGYSGVALKACKGHGEALLMAAAAQHFDMFLCVQDLTCVGASLLHSASLASHIPTVAAIESNGRQYCPAGNEAWRPQYERMFKIRDGRVPTGCLDGVGLGFEWPREDGAA